MPTMTKDKNTTDLAQKSINTIRFLAVDAVEAANSGHPGMPMGMAPIAYTLWTQFLKYNPKNPSWANRDRFVLSNGHGSMLLYAMLHLTGYGVSLDDLKNFRQWGSKTPGHPEFGHTPGVETTTGPLGQGLSTAVGMAMGQRYLNRLFPSQDARPLLDHAIWGFCGDGDLMEGVASEAASLAGHLKLSSLKFIFDDNHISIDGDTDLAFTEDVQKRFEAYGWRTIRVKDGNDLAAIEKALAEARDEKEKPTLVMIRTVIGFGSPKKAGTAGVHGSPLGGDETKAAKENLGWPLEPAFLIPSEVADHLKKAGEAAAQAETEWNTRFNKWAIGNAQAAQLWKRLEEGKLPDGWKEKIPDFQGEEKLATRAASGKVINALAATLPELIGGSADLAPSNNTLIKGENDFTADEPGRNLRFGVREHGMAAALNGLALTDKLIPYGGTFLIFSDYMKGGMRISALIQKRVVYVLTHDSIGLGEDGPTHQPIEQIAHLRAIPNLVTFRPADALETAKAWEWAIENKTHPVALALSRQGLPVLKKDKYPNAGQVEKGGYVLADAEGGKPDLILIATGSEVSLALKAKTELDKDGVKTRVVSLPSWELFENQPSSYRDQVLPPSVTARVSIEALSTFGWEKYTGLNGAVIGMTTFGASAPGGTAMEKFGFTVENVVKTAKGVLKK